ncbi:Abi family protein [Streptococcus halichoeri]|uniref:Abi family protein n=1 Tax=Streptococcus halichoeri TaxID=254785 RepID=UPI00135C8EAA|nr:Abi family protein [Streptococcus halichoeri]
MTKKHIQTTTELVKKMALQQGITFNYIQPFEAELYLKNVNNYFRTASYRKNFEKNAYGKYVNLDFLHLKELAILDMHYRYIVYKMCLDIEHSLKVSLIAFVEDFSSPRLNEYALVKEFLELPALDDQGEILYRHNKPKLRYKYIFNNIKRAKIANSYLTNLVEKYFVFDDNNKVIDYTNCPVWVLVEILSFGDFLNFFYFCQKKAGTSILSNTDLLRENNVINLVKQLRNAVAHNNCIFENLRRGESFHPRAIKDRILKFNNPSISKDNIGKRLTVRPVLELTALLLIYHDVVSDRMQHHRINEFKKLFFERMLEKKTLMRSNEILVANYNFITKIITNLY